MSARLDSGKSGGKLMLNWAIWVM
uniref:Uncharacterized protein n=1 Tax=Rhizophora mucronata TaxID=61149 RepID=A0A2P2PJU6_RHIMU